VNVRQTSFAAGVLDCTLAGSHFLFSHDLFHDQRPAMRDEIPLDVFMRMLKAVANEITHVFILSCQA